MAPPRKTIAQYEGEGVPTNGCLLHPSQGAARKVNILRHGPMPAGLCVCHTCDTPACIKDGHHWRGTKAQNTQDAVAKGRHSGFRKGGVRFAGGHSDEYKARVSGMSKERWGNPDHREAMSEKSKSWWATATPEQRANRLRGLRHE